MEVNYQYKDLIIKILSENDIPFFEAGKNVSHGYIGIKCPICGDHSNHCGINTSNMLFSCWLCHSKGHLTYLLSVLLGISRSEAEKLITEDIDFKESPQKLIYDKFHTLDVGEVKAINKISLPRCFELIDEEIEYTLLDKYLTRRRYTREFLISRNCGVCRAGPWMHRLIIPVFLNGEFVSFQGADLTGKADLKYKAGTDNIKSLLYNYDEINDVMIVTEGILDAWRVGDNAVCSFGTSITNDQKQLIINKDLKRLVFCWDSDAYWFAKEEAEYFRPFVDIVDIIKLPSDADPDEMEPKELKRILYGN